MEHVYTVVRQTLLTATAEQCWPYLVDGGRLTQWFADSDDLRPGASFRFAFGDGDFFGGVVTQWDPPVSLGLEWRFLEVGPSFDIRFSLLPLGDRTELTVIDRGAESLEEASGLHEGWEDFLMRCEKFVRTGENCRYRWTEVFGGAANVVDVVGLWSQLEDPGLWRRFFAGSQIAMRADTQALTLQFRDPVWNGASTQGELKIGTRHGRSLLHVAHRGWGGLPLDIQVTERSRYAAVWAAFLKQVECGDFVAA
jgi:uncharacterized protein YndB with AHSA1/START domain